MAGGCYYVTNKHSERGGLKHKCFLLEEKKAKIQLYAESSGKRIPSMKNIELQEMEENRIREAKEARKYGKAF